MTRGFRVTQQGSVYNAGEVTEAQPDAIPDALSIDAT